MRKAFIVLTLWAQSAAAVVVPCANDVVTAEAADPALAAQICSASDAALDHFQSCALPALDPVRITAVTGFERNCVGLYHCGEDWIEVLAPDELEQKRDEFGIFGHIPVARFFDSIVLHEMSHALYFQSPCPVADCVATTEYFAYTQQIDALSEVDFAPIAAQALDMPVRADVINAFILYMAPDKFALEAWVHLSARPDRCAQWRQVLAGEIYFDKPVPHP